MKRKPLSYLCAIAAVAVLLTGCTKAIQGTPVTAVPTVTVSTLEPGPVPDKEALARMSSVEENSVFTEERGYPEYRIGPGDLLEITFRVGSQYSTDLVRVGSDGTISYSFVDNLFVTGLTARELDEQLTHRLSAYVKSPRLDVTVKEFKSKSALVLGEVGALRLPYYEAGSGKVFLKGKTTLLDLLVLAGGYTEDADIKKVKLIRDNEIYHINLYDIIYRGETEQNVIINDGDVVDVPELPVYGERVYVMGEVNRQGVYPLEDVPDLLAAVALAGSFTRVAVEQNTLVIRGYEPGKKPRVLTADINALLKKGDIGQNITLVDGDVVYIPRSTIGDINEFIVNTVPMLDYLLYPGKYRDAYWQSDDLRFK